MSNGRISVVYLTDGRRDDLTYASAVALGLNHKRPLDIHIVQSGFHARPPASVEGFLQTSGHRLAVHALPAADNMRKGHGHITATAFAKVDAIASISDQHEIVCYLDNDTLAMRPLDLIVAAPADCPLAAVPDLSISTGLDNRAFFHNCEKHGLERRYFNSGLLVIDVARWRDSGIADRYAAAISAHESFCPYWDGSCVHLDQCLFNMAACGEWETLPICFNVQKSAFQTRFWDNALIRHYTGREKFLPSRAYRADKQERSLLHRIALACPGLGIRTAPSFMGLPYWANRIRRKAPRSTISGLIEEHLAS